MLHEQSSARSSLDDLQGLDSPCRTRVKVTEPWWARTTSLIRTTSSRSTRTVTAVSGSGVPVLSSGRRSTSMAATIMPTTPYRYAIE